MVNARQVQSLAAKKGVGKGVIEKDMALTMALCELSKTSVATQLVFKGGTALKKAYFPAFRYSEDLDFTVPNAGPAVIEESLARVVGASAVVDGTPVAVHDVAADGSLGLVA